MNFKIAAVFGLLALSCVYASERIVGGAPAEVGQFPYQVSLKSFGDHMCGGSIIAKNVILCAAHCNIGAISSMEIITGTNLLNSGGDAYKVSQYIVHEGWDTVTLENDIGLIILEDEIEFNDLVQPIALPTKDVGGDDEVVVSGWGYKSFPGTTPNELQWIQLKTITEDECAALHSGYLFDSQICTLTVAGEGICSGDSGGPLVKDDEVVGICSAAYLCAVGLPDFFTRVYYFNSWIEEQLSRL